MIRRLARVPVEGGISGELRCQDSQAFSPGLYSGQWQQFSRGLQTPDAATWTVHIQLCVLLRPQRETPRVAFSDPMTVLYQIRKTNFRKEVRGLSRTCMNGAVFFTRFTGLTAILLLPGTTIKNITSRG